MVGLGGPTRDRANIRLAGLGCLRWKKVEALNSGVVMRVYNTSVMQGRTSGREVRERRVEARQREHIGPNRNKYSSLITRIISSKKR
jgi:hypothetical protein